MSTIALINKEQSPKEKVRPKIWERLIRDKVARTALIILVFLYFCAAFADILAPYSMYFNDPDLANAPPTSVYCIDSHGHLCPPYIFCSQRVFDKNTFQQNFVEKTDKAFPIKFLYLGEPYKIWGLIPCQLHLFGVDPQARLFLLGSDINGRDNFSRLFFGAQKSLTIGFLGLFISFPIGIIYGALAGFMGGIADLLMMRFAEAVMSIPSFYLLIGMAAILPASMPSSERFALITVILSFIGWAGLARVIRGMVLTIKEEEFVQASIALGMNEFTTIIKHVIPQTTSFIIIAATLQVPGFILSESGLSFIGLGIQQPDASWGNMLKAALDNVNDLLNQPWLIAPGIAIFITILSFNTLGDVLRDVLDPKIYDSK